MSDEAIGDGPATPQEEGLRGLLVSLDGSRLPESDARTESIMGTARWQFVVRGTLQVLVLLTAAIAEGAALAAGSLTDREEDAE